MDLFHTITQGIDSVLTCHWFEQVKNFKMDNLMDTEKGGEQTQYESIKTETVPTPKQSGQLGAGEQQTSEPTDSVSKERGEQTAANVRYGQGISEQGSGGKTTTSTGEAQEGGSYGGAKADADKEKLQQTRRQQGYGGGNNIGA